MMRAGTPAAVQPAGTGEPLFSNSAQNTQWFEWPATSGIGGYKVQYSYYENSTLVADPTRAAEMGKAGRRRAVEKFSWGAIADETVALYRSLGAA